MNQKETKQVVETQESKEKKWLSSNEALSGGLAWQQLVDCWSVLEVALVSVSSPHNLPIINNFSQPVQNGSKPRIQSATK